MVESATSFCAPSYLNALFGPPPPAPQNDTKVEQNSRLDPVEPFVPGKGEAAAPAPPKALSSEDTFAAIQQARHSKFMVAYTHSSSHTNRTPCVWNDQAFALFDEGDPHGGVAALDENHQSVLQAHLAEELTREEFEGYMNKAISKRVISKSPTGTSTFPSQLLILK